MSTNRTATSRTSPPSSMSCSSAAWATSSPTWRPKRSRMRSRSLSPAAIRLKPAWSRPISLPSYTGTSTSSSPCSTSPSARRTDSTGSATARVVSQVMNSPTVSARPPSATDHHGQLVVGHLVARQRGHRHDPQSQQRHAAAQRPAQQAPGAHAGQRGARRRAVGQRAGRRWRAGSAPRAGRPPRRW